LVGIVGKERNETRNERQKDLFVLVMIEKERKKGTRTDKKTGHKTTLRKE